MTLHGPTNLTYTQDQWPYAQGTILNITSDNLSVTIQVLPCTPLRLVETVVELSHCLGKEHEINSELAMLCNIIYQAAAYLYRPATTSSNNNGPPSSS